MNNDLMTEKEKLTQRIFDALKKRDRLLSSCFSLKMRRRLAKLWRHGLVNRKPMKGPNGFVGYYLYSLVDGW